MSYGSVLYGSVLFVVKILTIHYSCLHARRLVPGGLLSHWHSYLCESHCVLRYTFCVIYKLTMDNIYLITVNTNITSYCETKLSKNVRK